LNQKSSDFLSNITIEAWVYRTKNTATCYHQGIVDNDVNSDRGISFIVSCVDNKLGIGLHNISDTTFQITSTEIIPSSTWHHVAFTYDGSEVKGYQNGIETMNGSFTGNIRGSTTFDIGFGQYEGNSNRSFGGQLDDVRIYNRALTPEEVARNYADKP